MALQTNTLSAALAALMSSGTVTKDSYIPVCNSSGNVTGKVKVSDLVPALNESMVSIKKGEDLNNYTTLGYYGVPDTGTAAEVSNVPDKTSGGRLHVVRFLNTSSVMQFYFLNSNTTPKLYWRLIKGISGTPTITPWQLLTQTAG